MLEKILVKEIINPICYIAIGFVAYLILSNIIKKATKIHIKQENERKKKTIVSLINNILKYLIASVVILMILEVYNVNTSAILASLGVVGLVVGLALQDLIKDFVAGIFIIFDDAYSVGDIVTINTFKGEVISLGLRSTKLKSVKGEVFVINNGSITEVINHSLSNSVAIVDIEVSYEEDLNRVIKVLNEVSREYEKKNPDLKGEIQVLGVTNLGSSGITIRLTVETDSEKQYAIERNLRKIIKEKFDEEKIEIPYQQVVVHDGKRI